VTPGPQKGTKYKPAEETRLKGVTVQFTQLEFDQVKERAVGRGQSVSSYLRTIILNALKEATKKKK
jgi:hypothetical protein